MAASPDESDTSEAKGSKLAIDYLPNTDSFIIAEADGKVELRWSILTGIRTAEVLSNDVVVALVSAYFYPKIPLTGINQANMTDRPSMRSQDEREGDD